MKIWIILISCLFVSQLALSQLPKVEVVDVSGRVPPFGALEYVYAFEAGDELIFSLSEVKSKRFSQVDILEYPSTLRYSEGGVSSVEKRIQIHRRGIIYFIIKNSSFLKRSFKIKIDRVPASFNTVHFNHKVEWKEVADTTYGYFKRQVVAGYDTTFNFSVRRELVKVDTIPQNLLVKNEQIPAFTSLGKPSYSVLPVVFPKRVVSPLESKEIISWAYWIGVGQEGHNAFEENKQRYFNSMGRLAKLAGDPLLGFALQAYSFLPTGNAGSNVKYYFMPSESDALLFEQNHKSKSINYIDKGNGVSAYSRFTNPTQGNLYIGLYNDNFHNDINVEIRVAVVEVVKHYEEKSFKEVVSISPHYEVKVIKEPVSLKIKRIPVMVE